MVNTERNTITRRQALLSLATITAGALIKPASVFGVEPVKNTTRFVVIGDWGTGCENQVGLAKQMVDAYVRQPFDFILAAGDNIYPDGSGRHFDKKFQQPYSGLIRQNVPFYTALGNHDVRDGRQDQTQYPFFNMNGTNYYMVSKGNGLVDFFILDSTDFDLAQIGWLEKSLRNSRAKWKIVLTHHPLYSSAGAHGSDLKLRKTLEPILKHYGVHVVFSGHDHTYERTTLQNGVQYFVSGAAGKVRRGDIDVKSPFRAASFDQDNHFMMIELDEKQVVFQAISEKGEVVDNGTIKQV